jgi:arylsulfatase A-like enzyme
MSIPMPWANPIRRDDARHARDQAGPQRPECNQDRIQRAPSGDCNRCEAHANADGTKGRDGLTEAENTWPDSGSTPFKGEKGTTLEGGSRVPAVVRWPGVIKPGTVVNDIMSMEDWLPTFLAAAGDPDVKTRLLTGLDAGGKTFKVHLDGYNFLPFFKGEATNGPRDEIFYFDDGANLNALRSDDWKITFQFLEGNIFSGKRTAPNMPFLVNLRQDPFERYPSESLTYLGWMMDKGWAFLPAQAIVDQFLQSFKEFPPSQKPGSP